MASVRLSLAQPQAQLIAADRRPWRSGRNAPQPHRALAPLAAELVAIGSRSLEKAEEFVKELQPFLTPACKAYGSYDEVLDIQGLDAVSIGGRGHRGAACHSRARQQRGQGGVQGALVLRSPAL